MATLKSTLAPQSNPVKRYRVVLFREAPNRNTLLHGLSKEEDEEDDEEEDEEDDEEEEREEKREEERER